MSKFGKSGEREANECVLTGKPVDAGNSVRQVLTGTSYFVRILSSQYGRVTPELIAQWTNEAQAEDAPKAEDTPTIVLPAKKIRGEQ